MRFLLTASCLVALMGQAYAQSPAANGYEDIVAAAVKEGKVVLYSPADPKNSKALAEDFRALYPKIELEIVQGSTMELQNRYLSQMAAGSADGDVLWSDPILQMKLVSDGYAMPYLSPEKSALPTWAAYKDEAYATTLDPAVIVYNKRLVAEDEIPTSHVDLVKILHNQAADLKGRFATYDLQTSGAGYTLANFDIKHWPEYWSLAAAQGEADAQYYPSGGLMIEMIASGQYKMGYNLPYPYARLRQDTDPNVGIAFLDDYVVATTRVAFISKAAPHPNAAKLLLDYMLSKRGQELMANEAHFGSIRSDVTAEMSAGVLTKKFGDRLVPVKVEIDLVKLLDPSHRLPLLRKWQELARK